MYIFCDVYFDTVSKWKVRLRLVKALKASLGLVGLSKSKPAKTREIAKRAFNKFSFSGEKILLVEI